MTNLKSGNHGSVHRWGIRVGTDLVASTMLGLGSGYLLDQWLDTRPIFLLIFFLFGAIAGFINIYRVMGLDKQDKNSQDNDDKS
ncbi:MAG: AtpZ/AtpI family protein [Mariprofundales bacterium]